MTYETVDNEDVEFKDGKIDKDKLEAVSDISISDELDNLVNLDDFSEGAVLHQLRKRYRSDKIYTAISTILVSINPYKLLPIYTSSTIERYREDYVNMAPHVFQIAADAYKRLLDENKNQAVIISGESGAGKTEATKTVLQYLSDVAGSSSSVEQQILQSNPVLEAFGNAKTLRNNNSSRFGKWMEVFFQVGGRICAAQIVNYLLEKSRIVKPGEGERSYHIFYQILAGLDPAIKEGLFLTKAEDYKYLCQSSCTTIPGVNDTMEFKHMINALRALNFEEEEITELWHLLAGVLNLGNLVMKADSREGTQVANNEELEKIAKVMQLNPTTLATALTFRSVTIRGSVSMIPLKVDEANESRDSLSKAMYSNMFSWLVSRVNKTLYLNPPKDSTTIGILDIFGFEIFDDNAFEQFCINYANEKLQQHFNEYIFKMEQAEYKREEVDVAFIEFVDNIDCLKLIEEKGTGVFAMLDEEVTMPKGSDKNFITKLHKRYTQDTKNPFYDQIRKKPEVFVIKHYAGAVVYNSEGMLEKNRDKLHDSLRELVMQSDVKLIRTVFAEDNKAVSSAAAAKTGAAAAAGGGEAKRGGSTARGRKAAGGAAGGGAAKAEGKGSDKKTLGAQFKGQLAALMETLHAANPHYIRCVKPNPDKIADYFESQMILRQLKFAGLFEAIRIRRAGYAFRATHEDFATRYRICLKSNDLKEIKKIDATDYKKQSKFILDKLDVHLNKQEMAIGKTKVLLRNSQRLILTKLRDAALTVCVLKIQSYARGTSIRKWYKKLKLFAGKIESELKSRSIEKLKQIQEEAAENDFDIFIMRKVDELVKYLEEEKRVGELLKSPLADYEKDISTPGLCPDLENGLDQTNKLKAKFPNEGPSDWYRTLVEQAQAAVTVLTRMETARKNLKDAVQNETIPELEAAIAEAKLAKLRPEEWAEAEKILSHLQWEVKVMDAVESAAKATEESQSEAGLLALEKALQDAETGESPFNGQTVAKTQPRKEIISNARETLKKGWFSELKQTMITANAELKSHFPTHEATEPAESLPLPPLEKRINEVFIPKFSALSFDDMIPLAQSFLAENLKLRKDAQKENNYNHMQDTMKRAEEDASNHMPGHLIDSPASALPLPPIELQISETIIPNLRKLGYEEFAEAGVTFLQSRLKARETGLKNAHFSYFEEMREKAKSDTSNHAPTWEMTALPATLPPHEATIANEILPRLTALGYTEFVESANSFLQSQLSARESALKQAHVAHLQEVMASCTADAAKYLPTAEQEEPMKDLPPLEAVIQNELVPRLEKLEYKDVLGLAQGFLQTQVAAREAESKRVKMVKADAERVKKEEEEARKRDEERKSEEERLKAERARVSASERAKLEEEDRKRRDAEETKLKEEADKAQKEREAVLAQLAQEKAEADAKQKALLDNVSAGAREQAEKAARGAAQLAAQQADLEKLRKEEEQKAQAESAMLKQKEEQAQAQAKAALEKKAVRRAPAPPPDNFQPTTAGGLPPPPPDDNFEMPPPPPPEEMELPPPPPPEDDGSAQREEELDKAVKARSLSIISTLLGIANEHKDNTRTVRIARNLLTVLVEERKIVNSLKTCLAELNVAPLKSLLREAANLGLDNNVVVEARHLCYGMSKQELITRRIQLALQNHDSVVLKTLLDEAKEDGIENDDIEHARDFIASDMGDWNSRMRVARSRTLSGITASQSAAYRGFLDSKGMNPLRKFERLRTEGNYAKLNYLNKKDLKKKRLVWQKEDVPRSLVKLGTAYCGSEKKSKLVKKIAKQTFKNIRGYMGDQYHAYPVTLAYEVINTGVNEELMRDEIFCQLIKQTSKNPGPDSALLGWKLLYLCASTFPPSDELRPYLMSHLAAHAPSKISQKEFGFNTIPELAYHCYVGLETPASSDPEPPSMQDIEKITNGTLGAVKSFFSLEADEGKKGLPTVETGDVLLDGEEGPPPPEDGEGPPPYEEPPSGFDPSVSSSTPLKGVVGSGFRAAAP